MAKAEIEEMYRKEAERIAKEYWGVEMTCPIVFVNREWKRRNASFHFNNDTGDCEIRMNHRIHEELEYDDYLPILKHELVHWYLWSTGQPCDDGDEGFVRECMRVGAPFSGTVKAQNAAERYMRKEAAHV